MAKRKKKDDPIDRFERLFWALAEDEEAAAVVRKSRLRLVFEFEDPEGLIAVNGRVQPFEIRRDDPEFRADLTLIMTCEIAEQFFLGTLEIAKALSARRIRSRGSIFRMLELRALMARARELYPEI